MTSSGRPFELIEVRLVDELGGDVAKDGQQASLEFCTLLVRDGVQGRERESSGAGAPSRAPYAWAGHVPRDLPSASGRCCNVLRLRMGLGLQVGEVWVRGPTVFDGYWGLPEATADSFAPGGWFK